MMLMMMMMMMIMLHTQQLLSCIVIRFWKVWVIFVKNTALCTGVCVFCRLFICS